jgi:hypothetical protein
MGHRRPAAHSVPGLGLVHEKAGGRDRDRDICKKKAVPDSDYIMIATRTVSGGSARRTRTVHSSAGPPRRRSAVQRSYTVTVTARVSSCRHRLAAERQAAAVPTARRGPGAALAVAGSTRHRRSRGGRGRL